MIFYHVTPIVFSVCLCVLTSPYERVFVTLSFCQLCFSVSVWSAYRWSIIRSSYRFLTASLNFTTIGVLPRPYRKSTLTKTLYFYRNNDYDPPQYRSHLGSISSTPLGSHTGPIVRVITLLVSPKGEEARHGRRSGMMAAAGFLVSINCVDVTFTWTGLDLDGTSQDSGSTMRTATVVAQSKGGSCCSTVCFCISFSGAFGQTHTALLHTLILSIGVFIVFAFMIFKL